MIKVKAAQDDSGHWYLIPNELYDQFINISDDIENNDDDDSCRSVVDFEDKFSKYRTGGDLNMVQLYIE